VRTFAGAAYRWLIAAFVLCVVVQLFLAAAGVFGEEQGVKLEDQSSWDPHRTFGLVLVLIGILLLVVCVAWGSERIWLLATFLLALLTFIQPILSGLGEDSRWVGALHGANAGVIMLLAGWLTYRAWKRDLGG
jgi:phosphatidylglycerophosphate synthase